VTFEDSGDSLGTVALGPTGQAALVDSALAEPGRTRSSAEYSGSTTFASSSSVALEQDGDRPGFDDGADSHGQPGALRRDPPLRGVGPPRRRDGVPTGTVTLMSGGSPVGTATLAGGTAAVVVSLAGRREPHSLTAAYAGDDNFSPSVSAVVMENDRRRLDRDDPDGLPHHGDNRPAGHPHRHGDLPWALPSGTVTFSAGGSSIGTASLSDGTADARDLLCPPGTQELSAAYAGTRTSAPPPRPRSRSRQGGLGLQLRLRDDCRSSSERRGHLAGQLPRGSGRPGAPPLSSPAARRRLLSRPRCHGGGHPGERGHGQSVTLTSTVYG
jgi:hypothetical protein